MPERSFIVVGAGMGGLAAALRLADKGHRVTVVEKTSLVGGRNRPVSVNNCRFDAGPTLMMMRDPFDRLFASVGERIGDHLQIQKLDPSYRVFFRDGTRLDASSDRLTMRKTINALCGEKESQSYERLLADLEGMYAEAIPLFVERNVGSAFELLSPKALRAVVRHRMLRNLAKTINGYFLNPKLRMLFSFQTMYLGLSPFEAPWVYATLTYMEYGEGIWYPQGGLVRIGTVVAELARQRGAEIVLNKAAEAIEGNTVRLADGSRLSADTIVVNADLPYAEKELLGVAVQRNRRFSCSACVFTVDYQGSLENLQHHNVFFGSDFKRNLNQIFDRLELPDDPAFYASISARSDPDVAEPGHENLFILVPCPNLQRRWSKNDENVLREAVFSRLSEEVGFDREKVAGAKSYGPNEYRSELNLEHGAAFGLSHHFSQSAFMRPSNRSASNPNVYFVGASTVPGNGLPMVLISAELLEDRLKQDRRIADSIRSR